MLPGRFMDIPDLCDGKMPEYTVIFVKPALTRLHMMGGIPRISTCMGSAPVRSQPLACVDRQSAVIRLHVRKSSKWVVADIIVCINKIIYARHQYIACLLFTHFCLSMVSSNLASFIPGSASLAAICQTIILLQIHISYWENVDIIIFQQSFH